MSDGIACKCSFDNARCWCSAKAGGMVAISTAEGDDAEHGFDQAPESSLGTDESSSARVLQNAIPASLANARIVPQLHQHSATGNELACDRAQASRRNVPVRRAAYGEAREDVVWDLPARSQSAWMKYCNFRADPGDRCKDCWLLRRWCCCPELAGIKLRQRVAVVFHQAELGRLRSSNTAKLLVQLGAELYVWGVEEHNARLQRLLEEHGANTVVLFPSADAVQARDLMRGSTGHPELPGCIVVLDGGWKETRKMNQAIDARITRCCVSSATRDEYGGTRKYGGSEQGRVQTAAAFIALMKELGEDASRVEELQTGLATFLAAFERQLNWSGVALASRNAASLEAAAAKSVSAAVEAPSR